MIFEKRHHAADTGSQAGAGDKATKFSRTYEPIESNDYLDCGPHQERWRRQTGTVDNFDDQSMYYGYEEAMCCSNPGQLVAAVEQTHEEGIHV